MRIGTSTALLIALVASVLAAGCDIHSKDSQLAPPSRLTEDEKHRLYSAALVASESPLDTDTFKDVCKTIEIFDANGKPNEHYMAFVSAHVDWGMKSETDQFRQEINSRQKAREYISLHLPR